MLTVSHTLSALPSLTGRVNLAQLAQVEAEHLPTSSVRLAGETDLLRRAREIASEQPELADEARFVVEKELHRRTVTMRVHA